MKTVKRICKKSDKVTMKSTLVLMLMFSLLLSSCKKESINVSALTGSAPGGGTGGGTGGGGSGSDITSSFEYYLSDACKNLDIGEICTVVGNPNLGDGINFDTQMDQFRGSVFDFIIDPVSNEDIIFTDYYNNLVWYINMHATSTKSRFGIAIPPRTVKIIAGTGSSKIVNTSGVTATSIPFAGPKNLVYDIATGALYVSMYNSGSVRSINDTTGQTSIVLGGGASQVDGQLGTLHNCSAPGGVAVYMNDLYAVCGSARRIKKVILSNGLASTVAGTGVNGDSNGVVATSANISNPTFMQATSNGLLFIDTSYHKIKFVNLSASPVNFWSGASTIIVPAGQLMTIAGSGVSGAGGTNVPPLNSVSVGYSFYYDGTNLYSSPDTMNASGFYIVNGSGSPMSLSTFATIDPDKASRISLNAEGYTNGPITTAKFYSMNAIRFHPGLNSIIVSDFDYSSSKNNYLRRLDLTSWLVSDYWGSGKIREGFSSDLAELPSQVIMRDTNELLYDTTNRILYFADTTNSRIRRMNSNGKVETALGNGSNMVASGENQAPLSSELYSSGSYILGMSLDSLGNLIFASPGAHILRALNTGLSDASIYNVSIPAGKVSTISGVPGVLGTSSGSPSNYYSSHNTPSGIVRDVNSGGMYVASLTSHCIRYIDANNAISTVAGVCGTSGSSNSGLLTTAFLNMPRGIAIDNLGNLIVADSFNGKVKYLNLSGSPAILFGGAVTVPANSFQSIVGTGASNAENVLSTTTANSSITDVEYISSLNLLCYIPQTYHVVRCIDWSTGMVTTKAGIPPSSAEFGPVVDSSQEGAIATSAFLNYPSGMTFDGKYLYFSETGNNLIRRVRLQ